VLYKNKNNIILKELDQSKKMLNDLMNNANGKKDGGNTEIDKLKKINMELIDQIEKIKEINNTKVNENIALVEEIKNLKNQIEKKDSIIFEFKEQINVRDNIINELKNQINERDTLLKEIKHQLNIKDNIIDELKIQIDEKDGDIKDREDALKSMNDQINEKDNLIEELKGEIENTKLQINSDATNEQKILLNDIITKTDNNEQNNNNDNNNINNENIDKMDDNHQEKNIKDINNDKINNNEKTEEKNETKKEEGKKLPPFYNRFRASKPEEKKELNNNNKDNEDISNNKETKDETPNNANENNSKKEESLANDTKDLDDKNINDNGDKNIKNDNNKIKESENQIIHGKKLEEEKDEVKDAIRKMDRKKNYTYRQKNSALAIDEDDKDIDLISANQTESKDSKKNLNYYLYGIDRNDYFHIFDVNNKKWVDKRKISDLKLDEKSTTFKKDYQYEGTILYNTLEGVYILTGEKTDTLYYFNSITNSITKICKFNNGHDNGSIMYDENENCLYVFGGKKINSCEYYSFNDKQINKLPDLITDRANASFIISNNKIFGFFGFSYGKNNYANSIEYINYNKKDKWLELTDINLGQDDISFDVESISTMYYKQNKDLILIYSGIQGDEEEFVTEYYLLYDAKNNTIEKINKWKLSQYRAFGKKWKNYNIRKNDPKGFHFAKNTRFLSLNKAVDGYDEKDIIDVLIDYKNNVHFILQEKEIVDIYRGNI